jgi:hypothetical protein
MNRETYPASMSPLVGDVTAGAGARQTTVVGIQNTPVSSASPNDQDLLRYNFTNSQWEPTPDSNVALYVNGIPVSNDPVIYVNAAALITVNGV